KLEAIIRPDIGIFTNIGSSHDEGFSSSDEKITEKFKLFKNVKKLICNASFAKYASLNSQLYTWSYDDETADLYIRDYHINNGGILVDIIYKSNTTQIQIPFKDKASLENAITCMLTLFVLGYEADEIANKIAKLHAVKMRLELKSGINNTSIIDDS